MMISIGRSVGTYLIYGVLLIVGGGLGSASARLYRQWVQHRSKVEQTAASTGFLSENLKGIAVGEAFPDVPLYSSVTKRSTLIPELLPHGGALIYISLECNSCLEVIELLRGECKANPLLGSQIVLILVGDRESAIQFAVDSESPFPYLVDSAKTLALEFGVVSFPSYFCIDSQYELVSYGSNSGSLNGLTERVTDCITHKRDGTN